MSVQNSNAKEDINHAEINAATGSFERIFHGSETKDQIQSAAAHVSQSRR